MTHFTARCRGTALSLLLGSATLMATGALGVAPARADAPAATVDLDLTFHVHKYAKGTLMIAVFDSESAYAAGDKPVRVLKLDVSGDTVHAVLPGLKAGRYGIKLFHDLNGSGKLTTNLFGIPTEPVAFSNNAKVNMRAPNWTEASFEASPGAAAQSIDID